MYGGAEQLMENLVAALRAAGHRADLIRLPNAWDRERVFDAAMAWRMLPVDADMVIATNFPSYFVRHPRKVVWLFHQHRAVYDLAGSALSDFDLDDGGLEEQRLLAEWDTRALEEASVRFTLSGVVSDRLLRYNGLTSTPLPHPPPLFDRLHPAPSEGALFTALRLEHNKRPELLIDAMAETKSDLPLHIAGTGSLHDELQQRILRHGLTGRVQLLGWTGDDELIRRYASARAVLYTPYDEDYGYVTLQAFAAAKPVVTTTDAGGVLEWVTDGVNGLVAEPTPKSVAAAIDRIAADDVLTQRLGRAGRERVGSLAVGAGGRGAAHRSDGAMNVPVLGLVSDVERADAVAPLLQTLSDRCRIAAWRPGLVVDAVLVSSWRAPAARRAAGARPGRVALWEDPADPAPDDWRRRATVTVTPPDPAVDVRAFRAVAPFLRARWRERFAIDVPVQMPDGLTWRQRRTFLSLCPAVVATGMTAIEALAFATPLVTDTATARLLGGRHDIDLVICDDDRATSLAEALGADHRRGASLGHRGRRLVEERHDLARVADGIAHALGWRSLAGPVTRHLVDLPTPPLSRPITRAEARLAELGVA